MTKPITATAVMILQDEGKLSIDDPVAKYIPAFEAAALRDGKPKQPVTLRHCLTHTAGLAGSQQNEGSLKDTIEKLAGRPLDFEPGTKWQYSPGMSVCGRVVEIVSGKPFDEFLAERIFRPLKMADTTFHPSAAQQPRLALLYQPGEGGKFASGGTTHWLVDLSPGQEPQSVRRPVLHRGGHGPLLPDDPQRRRTGRPADRVGSGGPRNDEDPDRRPDHRFHGRQRLGPGLVPCPPAARRHRHALARHVRPRRGAFGTQGWVDPQRQMIFVLMIQRTGFGNSDAADIRRIFQELAVKATEG